MTFRKWFVQELSSESLNINDPQGNANAGFFCVRCFVSAQRISITSSNVLLSLRRRRNGCDDVSNHQPHDCLLNRLFRLRSKKQSKLRVTGLCAGIHRGPVKSPHKWSVTWKMFSFDDVIMWSLSAWRSLPPVFLVSHCAETNGLSYWIGL